MQGNIQTKINAIRNGELDGTFRTLYVDERTAGLQKERYISALEHFGEIYGDAAVQVYSAPGRTEISGNHTDHQYGKVLAASVNLDAIAVVSERDDDKVLFHSEGYSSLSLDLNELAPLPREEGTTAALVRGVAAGMREKGLRTGGFNAYVTSQVLGGSGLSSSAAIETLIGCIFSGLYNDGAVDAVRIAQIGQFAENVYFGKPSGLMDQMACSVGGLIHIDFRDPAKPQVRKINVDFSCFRHSLCILDTKGSHADLTPDYAAIPEEMRKAASYFGKEVLGEVSEEDLPWKRKISKSSKPWSAVPGSLPTNICKMFFLPTSTRNRASPLLSCSRKKSWAKMPAAGFTEEVSPVPSRLLFQMMK